MPTTVARSKRDQGEIFVAAYAPWTSEIRKRQGRAYELVAPRKKLCALTGKSPASVHLRVHGRRGFDVPELVAVAKSADPRLNPFEPIADAIAQVAGARVELSPGDLLLSVQVRSHLEQKADGCEDLSQVELHEIIALIASKGLDRLTPAERTRAYSVLAKHRDRLIRYEAVLLALVADLEALLPHLRPTPRGH